MSYCNNCGTDKDRYLPCPRCGAFQNGGNNRIEPSTVATIRERLLMGETIRKIASDLKVAPDTIKHHRKVFFAERKGAPPIMCGCGQPAFHRGWCSARFKLSPARQAFMARWQASRPPKIIRIPTPPRVPMNYPFIPKELPRVSGTHLVLLVHGAVPKGLPEQIRGDVCQEIIAAVLAGEFTETEIPQHVRKIIGRVRRQESEFMALSLDAPRRDGRSWHEVLAAEYADDATHAR